MMFTTEMVQLFSVTLRRDCDAVTEALLKEGIMQFVSVSDADEGISSELLTISSDSQPVEISALRKRIEGFLLAGGITLSPPEDKDLANRVPVDLEKEANNFERVIARCDEIREEQRIIHQEVLKFEDIKRQMGVEGLDISAAALSTEYSFISMQIGKLPYVNVRQFEDAMKSLPSVNMAVGEQGDKVYRLLISIKRDNEQVGQILSDVGWERVQLPEELQSIKTDVSRAVPEKLGELIAKQKKLESDIDAVVQRSQKRLSEVWVNLRVHELLLRIQAHFKSSGRTVIFTGWLPASKKGKVTEDIRAVCGDRCYLEWNEPTVSGSPGDEVPVQFKNPKVLAPFQMLVSNFGVPRYGTIDPTPFVMPLYLAMFGLMFADVGQGFVLAILGALGIRSFGKDPAKASLHKLCWLIVWCGGASMFFGALFGSYFGTGLFSPLWFNFHGIISGHGSQSAMVTDVFDILAITLYFGISVILLGLVFNWINMFRAGKLVDLIFDKGGILGAWIYVAGIYIARYMISHGYKSLPSGGVVFVLVGVPCLLLFIKEPLHYFAHSKNPEHEKGSLLMAVMNWLMHWVVELLEIFSGYLANTLSFMRVAGLGIAHVCLMISFSTLAGMVPGRVLPILVLIIGNVLVIGLEGLSAGIQALRLNYYEFFTKFFHGTGKLYTPVSLNSKA